MEITSRFVEHNDLGQLHVIRFEPAEPVAHEHAAVFNSFNGRVTTIDGFAVPFLYAAVKNVITDYIERPNTGSSSPIEDARMRKNYRKHGFIEISDVVVEALSQDPVYAAAERHHASGFSLGGHTGSIYLDSLGDKAAFACFEDPAGFCSVNHSIGTSRFFTYLGLESLAKVVGAYPARDEEFVEVQDAFDELKLELTAKGIQDPPRHTRREKFTELHEVTMPTQGEALRAISAVMRKAADAGRPFEFRASFMPIRLLTDHRSVRETNEMLDRLDRDYSGQSSVRYGFLQHGDLPFWHDFATNPKLIRELLSSPIDSLRQRLSYFR